MATMVFQPKRAFQNSTKHRFVRRISSRVGNSEQIVLDLLKINKVDGGNSPGTAFARDLSTDGETDVTLMGVKNGRLHHVSRCDRD